MAGCCVAVLAAATKLVATGATLQQVREAEMGSFDRLQTVSTVPRDVP